MPVTKLIRVSITVSDLAQTAAFYSHALGLEVGTQQPLNDPAWTTLLGLPDGSYAHGVDVSLGSETIKLVSFDPPGRDYPPAHASNDPWFEHLALVAGDIETVWTTLEKASPETITEGPPVVLPPNTGSVTAFKFRDPEGHPLELISFPDGVGDPRWQMGGAGIRGYDHTAIAVTDLEKSLAFYEGLLGLEKVGQSLNRGPEQDHLDGLKGCEVDVVALAPAEQKTPHLELLLYRLPPSPHGKQLVQANDVASARQVYAVDDLDGLVEHLRRARTTFVSPEIAQLKSGGRAAAVRDPDGHMIVLMG
ncbi:VOC family protein [Methyloligella solikamskensis]|uniref:VOC family protein n=1 Tax=Methyloligella solikamskensis TaxID=1177756 RepID=A0ABW3J8X7_9HYPH